MSDDFRDDTKKMDVIYREEAIDAFKKAMCEDEFRSATGLIHKTTAYEIIQHLPSAQSKRPKGEWLANGDIPKECPFCGEDWDKYVFGEVWYTDELPKFCPNCGADMRGERNETD